MRESAGSELSRPRELSGDELEDAFARFQDELLGALYHMVGNRDDAQDAFQETFVKCWRHRNEVAEVQNLKAWIFRIALNTARDLRMTAWRRKRKPLPEDAGSIRGETHGPEVEVEHQEQLTRVRYAVSQLRSEEQEVFLLRQNGEMTYEEIAEALDIPSGTVKTRMRLAVLKLREVLAEST